MDNEYRVISSNLWHACFWLQNDLVHGWGLDFALRRCVPEVIIVSEQYCVRSARLSQPAAVEFWSLIVLLS